ncbi:MULTISPECIES: DUF58 domain-containing protein [unclassified Haladaptatus]|uniref:DUF58 domain-containing protein n=1 Tax=unclassified Haladaptatus TaxID=2622732 RepID=UPI0023E7933E|nr:MULTISPECIES: DUF58 domain-containing protein [unclassified Haladaptatus]
MLRETKRWRGVAAIPLLAAMGGLLANRPLLLLVSVVGVVYLVYPRVTGTPAGTLELERRLNTDSPDHDEPVEVTTTLRNTGSSILPDVRIVDGVPETLTVSEGTPRHSATLLPGRETTFTYTITAKRGAHPFTPATVVLNDIAGAREVETTVATETELRCDADVTEMPLRQQTSQLSGRILTADGGSGVEFHQTREYRPGDSIHQIDWNRHARTGELSTIEFRQERAARVVVLVDAREQSYRRANEDDPHAVAFARYAAEQLFESLLASRDQVGLAAVGREFTFLEPGAGREQRTRGKTLLATSATLAPRPPAREDYDSAQFTELRTQLAATTQLVVISPLVDDDIVEEVKRLDAHGHRVTVLSPRVTGGETLGSKVAHVERDQRIRQLRAGDIPVIDWDPDRALEAALEDIGRWRQ